QLRDPGVRQVGAVRVAGARADPGPHSHSPAARFGQALHLAAVHPDLPAPRALRPGLGLARAGGGRRLDCSKGRLLEVRLGQTAVPPTVRPRIRTWPCPVPTGAVWPDLPQNPVFISKSEPTASIRASAWRQLPISVAPRQGFVTRPPSIR